MSCPDWLRVGRDPELSRVCTLVELDQVRPQDGIVRCIHVDRDAMVSLRVVVDLESISSHEKREKHQKKTHELNKSSSC